MTVRAADATLQLNKNAGATYMYAASFGDSLEFIPVAKEIYTDKYVGYKHLTNDELITNKYTSTTGIRTHLINLSVLRILR